MVILLVLLGFTAPVMAQLYIKKVTTANNSSAAGVTFDSAGNMYISDSNSNVIRKMDSGGTVTTYAGTGGLGYAGDKGAATAAQLSSPLGITADSAGNLYIVDAQNNVVRKVYGSGALQGTIWTVGVNASMMVPWDVAVDGAGNLYVSDPNHYVIRKLDSSGVTSIAAGTGSSGYSGDGGQATAAQFQCPGWVAVDTVGNLYISDYSSSVVRKVLTNGIVHTVAGSGSADYSGDGGLATAASLNCPSGIAVDGNGNLYIADRGNNRIRKVDSNGIITTVAGNGTPGSGGDDGLAAAAEMGDPYAICVDGAGNLYIADQATTGIRMIYNVVMIPVAPTASPATAVTADGFTAHWDAAAEAASYRLDVSTNGDFTACVAGYTDLDVGNVTTFAVSGLNSGTAYSYRVRAVNTAGTSGDSGTISQTTLPAAPTATAASDITVTGFTANWGTVTGASSYRLDVSASSGFTTCLAGYADLNVNSNTSCTVVGLSPGTAYYYRVRAVGAGGAGTNSGFISLVTIPAAPTAMAASGTATAGFTANWGAVIGASGYRLDVSTNADFTACVAEYTDLDVGNVTTFAVSGLSAGTAYSYRVRAVNTAGTSVNSGTIGQTTLPAAPTAEVATDITETGFTANWGTVSGATGYRLDIATDYGFTSFAAGCQDINAGPAVSYAVSGLSANTAYYYRVRAVTAGGSGGNSPSMVVFTPGQAATGAPQVIVGGLYHSLVLINGAVTAFGDNSAGQCDVPGDCLSGVYSVYAAGSKSMAMKTDGSIYFWGQSDAV